MWIKTYVFLFLSSILACAALAGCEGEDDDERACHGRIDDDFDEPKAEAESAPGANIQGDGQDEGHGRDDDDGHGRHDDDGDCVQHQKARPVVDNDRTLG